MALIDRTRTVPTLERLESGRLDGFSLLRYAHIWRDRDSGGVEQYLKRLNAALLKRQNITIYQTYLCPASIKDPKIEMQTVGKGRIVWVPIPCHTYESSYGHVFERWKFLTRHLSDQTVPGFAAFARSLNSIFQHKAGHFRFPFLMVSRFVEDILANESVDLLTFHWVSYDAQGLVKAAKKRGVSFALINHFENKRLSRKPTSHLLQHAAGIGGVSAQGVPDCIRDRYRNLSDAIDAEYFSLSSIAEPKRRIPATILLPARITPGKGHLDLIQAAGLIGNVTLRIAFAGVSESNRFKEEVESAASASNLARRIDFLGQLDQEQLRNAYASSSIVALPSSSEGLPRVLLEAQAMERPVVAYACGGIPDALIDQSTGFLVAKGDIHGLAGRLKYLLDQSERAIAMGREGRRFILEKFNFEALLDRHESFYEESSSKHLNGSVRKNLVSHRE